MTKKQLEKLGIIHDKNYRYWCNATQCYIDIFNDSTMDDILQEVYQAGEKNGIKEGKSMRSKEFRDLLNDEIY